MTPEIERALALVTLAMPVVIVAAHALLSVANKLHEHALTTPSTGDDDVTARILAVAKWLDVVAVAVAQVASMGLFSRLTQPVKTPHARSVDEDGDA